MTEATAAVTNEHLKGPEVVDNQRAWFKWVIILALVCFPLAVRDPFFLHTGILIFFFVLQSSSYRFILNTGQLHFGAHGFIAVGAYSSVLLCRDLGFSFWLALPTSGLVAAFFAVIIGYPALRVKGIYFAIITWGFAETIRYVVTKINPPFGGPSGFIGITRPEGIGPIQFTDKIPYYYLSLALMLFALWVLYRMEKSRLGLIYSGIHDADNLAASVGVNIMNYKVLAFAVASGLAGMGGSFYAHYMLYISPNDFHVILTITLALYVVVGGLGSFYGPIVGTLVLYLAGEFFAGYGMYRMMLFAGMTIIVLLFLPGGMVNLPERISLAWRRRG